MKVDEKKENETTNEEIIREEIKRQIKDVKQILRYKEDDEKNNPKDLER